MAKKVEQKRVACITEDGMTKSDLFKTAETEEQFLKQVIDLAKLTGWRVAHFRPAKTERGWRTAVQADGAGFPDLVLTRQLEIIFAELKSEKGVVSLEQGEWIDALRLSGVPCYVWRPSDWDRIVEVLKR